MAIGQADSRPAVSWYYDFISPFAYLQHEALKVIRQNRPDFAFTPVPVLFAGLLKHHEHKGPAEIESKRRMTYRYCAWYAARHGIPFRMPAMHPFNPLPFLRLAISRDNDPAVVDRLFHHIWVDSADDPDFASPEAIRALPGFENAMEEIARAAVKDRLKTNTGEAIAAGVFGVPTLCVGSEMFWGLDMTEMALAYHDDRAIFESAEYQRIGMLDGMQRRR